MTALERRSRWPGPEYHVRQRFQAPLPFVYKWCTHYTSKDPSLEHERYERRIVVRERGRVVYEDLAPAPDGWAWARDVVILQPPNTWHMESIGNRRCVVADYVLSSVAPGVTELDLRWRRRASLLAFVKNPKVASERSGRQSWRLFARALERDYRRSTHPRPRRRK